jgi:hypothetical protein
MSVDFDRNALWNNDGGRVILKNPCHFFRKFCAKQRLNLSALAINRFSKVS